jgi:ribulose-phosphate 3-epimerase
LIHENKMKSGLAISPDTPASSITEEMGSSADMLLVMPECLKKVEDLRSRFPSKNIQVDGGVGPGNCSQCAKAGMFWVTTLIHKNNAE